MDEFLSDVPDDVGGSNRILVIVVLRLVLGAFQIQEAKSNKREAVQAIARLEASKNEGGIASKDVK